MIRFLAENYDDATKTIRKHDGTILVDINKMTIVDSCGLSTQELTTIDLDMFQGDYGRRKRTLRENEVPLFRLKGWDNIKAPIFYSEKEPFLVENFENYFIKTYYALWQFLEEDPKKTMPIGMMMMTMRMQHKYVNREYDYATYIKEKIHQGLINSRIMVQHDCF